MLDKEQKIMVLINTVFDLLPENNDELNITIENPDTNEVMDLNIKVSFKKNNKKELGKNAKNYN